MKTESDTSCSDWAFLVKTPAEILPAGEKLSIKTINIDREWADPWFTLNWRIIADEYIISEFPEGISHDDIGLSR